MYLHHVIILLFYFTSALGCPPPFENRSRSLNYKDNTKYRLPSEVVPVKYEINLEPDLEKETFVGNLKLDFTVKDKDIKTITLHTRSLTLETKDIKVTGPGEEVNNEVEKTEFIEDTEFFLIHMKEPLTKDSSYKLIISKYTGKLHRDNGGFYLAEYKDEQGNVKRLATTQFESTNARRAFPSLDEPAMKAKFLVTIKRKPSQTSITNEKLKDSKPTDDGFVIDTYEETKVMSTYLTAFVVSEFDFVEDKTNNQRVYARPQAIKEKRAEYALKTGVDILHNLQEYLGHPYEFSKMDQIAIPDKYFAAGAMENWGLVTYKENYLLYDEKTSTTSEHQRVTTIIAHEFAHQWFGNLVTMSWWNYLWLNEGFATYFEYYSASLYQPNWRLMDQFIIGNVQRAFELDALESTEPMNHEGETPGTGPPNHVAYQKSGSVIRMFANFLTEDIYQKGLQKYLKKRAYNHATPNDLYDALQEAITEENKQVLLGDKTVSEILSTWDSLKGYPVVDVEKNYNTNAISLKQNRFLLNKIEENKDIWYIPINIVFGTSATTVNDFSDTTSSYWLTEKNATIPAEQTSKADWYIVNKQQTGYYRVNYDVTNWRNLILTLVSDDFNKIHVLNRAQLIDDAFNLARSGRLNYEEAFALGYYLHQETDYIPFTSFLNNVNFLNNMLAKTQQYNLFKTYVVDRLKGAYKRLTAEEKSDDKHLDKLNRANIINWLCKLGHEECRNMALEKLRKWNESESDSIKPNLQDPIFCGAIAAGTQNEWDMLYNKYETLDHPLVRNRIIKALGCSENEDITKGYLQKIIDDTSIEEDHKSAAFSAVYTSGPVGLQNAFEFIKTNYDAVKTKLPLQTIITNIGKLFTTPAELKELKDLKDKNAEDEELFKKGIENAGANVEWTEEHANDITKWLSDNVRGSSGYASINFGCLFIAVLSTIYANLY